MTRANMTVQATAETFNNTNKKYNGNALGLTHVQITLKTFQDQKIQSKISRIGK